MNKTIYKPTFLQNLLGKHYKWWYIIKYSYSVSNGNLYSFVFYTTIKTLEFLAIIYIWKINNSDASIITYLALGMVFDRLSFTEIPTILQSYINRGGLTRYLLIPTNFFVYMIADNIGFNLIRSIINSVIIFGFAFLIFNSDLVFSLGVLYLFSYLILTYLMKSFFGLITGSLAFWINENANARAIVESIEIASRLFSGGIIPLFVLFSGFFNPIFLTPFAFTFHHPMQIYLGKYSPIQTFYVIAGGIAWCIILYLLAKLVFKLGLKKNEAVGL